MSTSPHGMADLRDAIIGDLRDHDPLVAELPERTAVYDAWPNQATEYDIQLVVAAVWHGSKNRVSVARRTARVQCSVVSTRDWRDGRPDATADMMDVLDHAADRLDLGCDTAGVYPRGTAGTGGAFELDDIGQGRQAFTGDWLLQYSTEIDT